MNTTNLLPSKFFIPASPLQTVVRLNLLERMDAAIRPPLALVSDVFVDNMGVPEPFASVQRFFVRLYTSSKYGFESRHITRKNQIQNLGSRPALLIHSTGDSQIPHANFERIMAQAPDHVETWVREGDIHFIVLPGSFLTPEEDTEYAGRILQFLNQHFGE